jgi:hypothetical protein
MVIRYLHLVVGFGVAGTLALTLPPTVLQPPRDAVEETRMYRVRADRPLRMRVPAGSEDLVLRTVAEVPFDDPYDPERRYRFGLVTRLLTGNGRSLMRWTVHLESRVSIAGNPGDSQARRATVLRGVRRFATDLRDVVLPVGDFADQKKALVLELRSTTGPHDRLLVRGAARRSATLAPAAQVDLSTVIGLATGQRSIVERLTALGQRGVDYEQETVRLTDYRRLQQPDQIPPGRLAIGPWRWLVFNLQGPARLIVEGKPRARIHLLDGVDDRPLPGGRPVGKRIVLDAAGRAEIAVAARDEMRSVLLSAASPGWITVFTLEPGRLAGKPRERSSLKPDLVRLQHERLDPQRPLIYALEPQQPPVRLRLRGRWSVANPEARRLTARYLIVDGNARVIARGTVAARVSPTPFDRWTDGATASRSIERRLEVPRGAAALHLLGPSTVAARVLAEMPSSSMRRFVRLQPRSSDISRRRLLAHQWLIVPRRQRPRRPEGPAVVLRAEGTPLRQRVMVQRRQSGGTRPDAPVLTSVARPRVIVARGDRPHALILRAAPQQLGRTVAVQVDGRTVARQRLVTTAQRLWLTMSAGAHHLRIRGLGRRGRAWIDASARRGRTVLRPRVFERLDAEGLVYTARINRRSSATFHAQLLGEMPRKRWTVSYRVVENGRERAAGRSLGITRHAPDVVLRDGHGHVGIAAVRFRLPSPNAAGAVQTVELRRVDGEGALWIRALVRGAVAVDSGRFKIAKRSR